MRVPQNQEENHGNQSIQSIPDHFVLLKVKTKTFHIFAVPYGCSKVHHQNICRKGHFNQLQVSPLEGTPEISTGIRTEGFFDLGVLTKNSLDHPKHPGQQNILQ